MLLIDILVNSSVDKSKELRKGSDPLGSDPKVPWQAGSLTKWL